MAGVCIGKVGVHAVAPGSRVRGFGFVGSVWGLDLTYWVCGMVMGPRVWDLGHGVRNRGSKFWGLGSGVRDPGRWIWGPGYGATSGVALTCVVASTVATTIAVATAT